jgi:bacterioferritin-associated ferredoxin
MLCSFITDPIAVKVQCGECLYETKVIRDSTTRQRCYIVLYESIAKMLCSFITDLIPVKIQCGECLCKTKIMTDSTKK